MTTNDVIINQPQGDLTAATSTALKAQLIALQADGPRRVVVDLAAVPFIDSSGLGALVAGLKAAKLHGGELALAAIRESAQSIFVVTMAEKVFPIFPSVEDALAALNAPAPQGPLV